MPSDTPASERVQEARKAVLDGVTYSGTFGAPLGIAQRIDALIAAVREETLARVREKCIPNRDDLATLIEIQADQPEDVADRVIEYFTAALAALEEGR